MQKKKCKYTVFYTNKYKLISLICFHGLGTIVCSMRQNAQIIWKRKKEARFNY